MNFGTIQRIFSPSGRISYHAFLKWSIFKMIQRARRESADAGGIQKEREKRDATSEDPNDERHM